MSDDKGDGSTGFELTRRRALGGLLTLGAAGAAGGAGTFAYFSDTETSNNNTVSAGTLNLTPNGSSVGTFDVGPIAPGDSGTKTISLTNSGSLTGYLNVYVHQIEDIEGAPSDADITDVEYNRTLRTNYVNQSYNVNGPDEDANDLGELSTYLDVNIGFGSSGSISTKLADGYLRGMGGVRYLPYLQLDSGEQTHFVFDYALPPAVDNRIQGDQAKFDVTFELEQTEPGSHPTHQLTGASQYANPVVNGYTGGFDTPSGVSVTGSGAWRSNDTYPNPNNTPWDSAKEGFWFGGEYSSFHTIPDGFTVDDIEEISYWMRHSNSQLSSDFYIQIYTEPDASESDGSGWFGKRLTAVPANAENGSPNWSPDEWYQFSTDSDATNQMYFFRGATGVQDLKTLQTIQDGSDPWSDGIDYGSQEVLGIALQTASNQVGKPEGDGNTDDFRGYIDDVTLSTTNNTIRLDLEP